MKQKSAQTSRAERPSKPEKRKRPLRNRPAAVRKPPAADRVGESPITAAQAAEPAPDLQSAQRKQLRALAHHLTPIVQVGHEGVTEAVATATSQALLQHELIKVRLHEPEDKRGMAAELAQRTRSALCGLLGHTVILYRPHPVHPAIPLRTAQSVSKRAS